MKALKITKDNSVDIVYAEDPAIIKPTDVKVKIAFASICGFDIMMIKGLVSSPHNGEIGH